MEIIQEAFIGAVKVLKPKIFGDNRGFFQESYNEKTFHNLGIMENFIQDNHSFSKECGTLRGFTSKHNQCLNQKLLGSLKVVQWMSSLIFEWVLQPIKNILVLNSTKIINYKFIFQKVLLMVFAP